MNLLFFKLAFRNIIRNKLHSLINIIGFSIGIATILFIFLFVKFETSFDNFFPEGERIYRVIETMDSKSNHSILGFTRYPEASDMKDAIPGIDEFCRISKNLNVKCLTDNQLYPINNLRYTDDNFFPFFDFRLIAGNPLTVLNSADKIVLSEKTAKRIFGKKNPVGQIIIYNQKTLTVSGIAEDLPANTHLKSEAFISIKYVKSDKENFHLGWGGGMEFLSYLKLTRGISPEKIEAEFPNLYYEKANKWYEKSGIKLSANLQKIRDVHLTTGKNRYDCPDNRSKNSILIVAAIGLFILILAMLNFISLYVAQWSEKIRDISLLAIHGAGRRQLTIQAYTEVLIISMISAITGIMLFTLLIPFLNNFLGTSVSLRDNLLSVSLFMAILILFLSLIITLLSTYGIFKVRIADTIKDSFMPVSKNNIMVSVLVTFQFTIVVFLIISGLFINRQNQYVLNKELGFTKENILTLFPDNNFKHNALSTFKQELHKMPEISNVSLTSQRVGGGLTMNGYQITGEKESTMLNVIYADNEFLDCFGIRLTSGRNFKEGTTEDNNSIIVNQKLVKSAGWQDPINMTIKRNGLITVIGTVEDFNFAPLNSEIRPLLIMCNPAYDGWGYNCVNIRYQTGDILSLVKKIRQLWERDYPDIPYGIAFLSDQLAYNYGSLVSQKIIVIFFSLLAIIIASMGLFGLTSFVASRRTKEIGIRRVTGAKVSEVMLMLNEDFLKGVLISIIIAVPLAWYAMHKWLENFAYKTDLSWWIFALAGALALGIAFLTVSWQSWKAASMNPVETLRYE